MTNIFGPGAKLAKNMDLNSRWKRAVVVAQLAEQSLLTPEIRGSNPNIGKHLCVNCKIKKRQKLRKRGQDKPIKKPSI